MLKKTTLSLMVSVLCIQQSLAGTGGSTPLKEEQGNLPKTTKRPVPTPMEDDDGETILAGVAALTIGAVVGYGLYRASQEPKSSGKSSSLNFEEVALGGTGKESSKPYSRPRPSQGNTGNFAYSDETFSQEAWRKDNNLPNSFSTSGAQRRQEPQIYREKTIIKGSEYHSDYDLGYSQKEDNSYSLQTIPQAYKGCPVIDLSDYQEITFEGVGKIDLHPVYNGNFEQHLRNEVNKHQLAYQRSEIKENKFYIITGTGKQRAGPNFRLQNAVSELLKEDYYRSRIAYYRIEKEGVFAIFLRKNKKTDNSGK